MFFHGASLMLALFAFSQLQMVISDCPLNLSHLNFTLAASVCSKHDRGKCCRYINAFLAVSIAWYANATGQLGVPLELSESCLNSVSETLQLYGIPSNATAFCGLGTKIPVNYQCKGKKTVVEMMHSPKFDDVILNCKFPFSAEDGCRGCITAEISYLRQLVGTDGNTTFSTCRDATFVTLASQLDNLLTIDMASCFFGIPGFSVLPAVISDPPSQPPTPEVSPIPVSASSPSQHLTYIPSRGHRRPYHLTIIPVVGILVTGVALLLLIILILLIHRKSRELKGSKSPDQIWNGFQPRWQNRKSLEGPSCMFRRFSYKETKKATGNFCSVIGRGGFGTVYKAQFGDDFVAAVKRMNKVSEQGEDAFCREMELLGRLHHRHLVVLRGFCVAKHERFLMYEFMGNGSLKDHLHSPGKAPLSWQTRIQIAIDVANALEYLHFYCDPPLCHRDIKSSNILLDDKFVAKVADFGLAHAVGSGAISFEPVNTDIRGTPGYMDPEYVVTQELTEKSDIYSYGVLLLELVTARKAIQENRNLVEWSQIFMLTPSRLHEMVDPLISDSYDLEQLQTVATIVRWCTQREGTARPSIKQILRLLHERLDRVDSDLAHAFEDEGAGGIESGIKGKEQRCELILHSGEARGLPSSSSTSRSFCSKSFLLETSSSP